jgi:hypothetical protein
MGRNRPIHGYQTSSLSGFCGTIVLGPEGGIEMIDARDPDDESRDEIVCSEVPRYDPPDWISTDWLETELWNAILDDTPGCTDEDIDKYDDGFEDSLNVDDDEEDEEEKRRSTFTLLVGMRPLLGELLGGPPIL